MAKKLGVVDGQKTWRVGMPDSVSADIASSGSRPALFSHPVPDLQMVHIFVTLRCELASRLAEARQFLAPNGMIWVSWPKKSSGKTTDISDETVRAEAFPLGLVDVKVCAVDEIWSGLKLVIRKMNRL
ncbi:DUF3052 domain-containing protein [Terriglobus aquaticus]|uniref:DUF3052 domain-containing protein n=1 Tax=Terriglobus aquaticus TaxID=940139 RepID=A0ABW9KK67_9BACT|nr:DUF3052 domain-containing protein [Terriglobus aquaticus]